MRQVDAIILESTFSNSVEIKALGNLTSPPSHSPRLLCEEITAVRVVSAMVCSQ